MLRSSQVNNGKSSWTSVRSSHETSKNFNATKDLHSSTKLSRCVFSLTGAKRWVHNWQFECKFWIDLTSAATSFFMGTISTPFANAQPLLLPLLLRRWGDLLASLRTTAPSRGRTRLTSHPTSTDYTLVTMATIYWCLLSNCLTAMKRGCETSFPGLDLDET